MDVEKELKRGVGKHLRIAERRFNRQIRELSPPEPEFEPYIPTPAEAYGAYLRGLDRAFRNFAEQVAHGWKNG